MKLGMFALTYERLAEAGMTSVEMVDLANEQGFKAFEPYPYSDLQSVDDAIKVKKAADKHGMVIPCFSTGVDLLGPDAPAEVERMKLYIEMAAAMRSPYFHHTIHPQLSIDDNTPSLEAAMAEAVPRLKELCEYATERKVTCLYEEQGMLFNGVGACRKLAEEMEGSNYGFCLDAGNIYFVDERPIDFAVTFPQKIKHMHLKDYYVKPVNGLDPGEGWLRTKSGDYLRDAIPGHGDIEYESLLKMVKRFGYNGYFSLEYCGPEDHSYAIPQSISNLNRYYDEGGEA